MKHLKACLLIICMSVLAVSGCASNSGTETGNGGGTEVEASVSAGESISETEVEITAEETTEGINIETAAETSEETVLDTTEAETVPYVFEDVNETVYAVENVNIRAGYSTESEIYAVLHKREAIVRTGYSEEWSRVLYNDTECYIASAYLSTEEPP